jgi:membrane protein DedA with SNARE-associated domain
MGSFSIFHWLIALIWCVIFIFPAWKIATKAGFPGALSLLMLIPVVNIILIWVFAFIKWPVEKSNA